MPQVDVAGTPIHYHEAGTGAPVVFLHGLYRDADCWTPLADELAHRYRVIRYDLRGCGRSGDGPSLTVARLAADLGVLLDELTIDQAVVVGHSLGGQAALQFAVEHPERLRGLVLASVSPLAMDPTMAPAYGAFTQLVPAMGLEAVTDAMLALVYAADSLERGPAGAERYRRQLTLLRRPEEVVAQIQAYIGRPSLADRLGAITCPTLIVTGDLDTTVPLAGPMLLQARVPGAELVVLPDASHMAPLERADAFKAALLPFIAQATGS